MRALTSVAFVALLSCGGLLEDDVTGTTTSCHGVSCLTNIPKVCADYAYAVTQGGCTAAVIDQVQISRALACSREVTVPTCESLANAVMACLAGRQSTCTGNDYGGLPTDLGPCDPGGAWSECSHTCSPSYASVEGTNSNTCLGATSTGAECCTLGIAGCSDAAKYCSRVCSPCGK